MDKSPSKMIMCFAPSRIQLPNLVPQDMLVRKFAIKDASVMLQSNTPTNGINCTLPQKFGFLPPSKSSKTSQ